MTAYYTLQQLQVQARVLEEFVAADDRSLETLDSVPEDVREEHKRTITMRRSACVERLKGLRTRMHNMEQSK